MFDLEDLRIFVEVADAGGVTPAARRLGLSKSMVSRSLMRLEQELGARLLSRSTRGASLTEAGVTFREHASRIASELEAARDAISPEGEVRGRLRLSAPLSLGPAYLAPALAELARWHPRLQVHAAYTDRFVDLVSEGFDAAVRIGYLADSSLIARRIAPIRGRFVASPGYIEAHGAPETPEDMVHHEALMQGNEPWRFMRNGKAVTMRVHGRFKANSGEALVAAALAGIGIGMEPDYLIDAHIASGALVPVLTDYPPPEAGLFVLRPPGDSPPRKVRALIEILVERFGSAGDSLTGC
jgi:DNA-binding transcriptional LysR family regulator